MKKVIRPCRHHRHSGEPETRVQVTLILARIRPTDRWDTYNFQHWVSLPMRAASHAAGKEATEATCMRDFNDGSTSSIVLVLVGGWRIRAEKLPSVTLPTVTVFRGEVPGLNQLAFGVPCRRKLVLFAEVIMISAERKYRCKVKDMNVQQFCRKS